ncbi:hypothetical protein ACSBLW_17780 [Thioclava sp. FR2]|uniref:hypothetical protein n=1 Tax=Thioclava sp. FR2 TaxID=3445780 RepID=UPI003EB7EBA8
MRNTLVLGLTSLLLAACGGGLGGNPGTDGHVPVCQEQSDWARSGTVPDGEIAISCPAHGIGDYGN